MLDDKGTHRREGQTMSDKSVVLAGGEIETRVQQVPENAEVVKVPIGSGYDHFSHQGAYTKVGDQEVPVYQWVMHTAIAE